VATKKEVNLVVRKLEACAVKSIRSATRRDLQFDTANSDAALFTRMRGLKNQPWPQLRAKIKVGDGIFRYNKEMTLWLGVWMDAHTTFKEHHNRCMKMIWAAEALLRVLTRTHGMVPDRVRYCNGDT